MNPILSSFPSDASSKPSPVLGLGSFWYDVRNLPKDPTTSYAGKTILITGANVGLGFEAAQKFAALGASTLIFGVRSLEKGATAKALIEKNVKCPSNVIQLFQVDMSEYNSMDRFAKEVSSKFEKIDIVVLNAGVGSSSFCLGPEGIELTLQVNALSAAYLGILLLPKLRATAASTGRPSHLEFVTSVSHKMAPEENVLPAESGRILDRINDKATFNVMMRYPESKLLEMWLMRQIAARTSPNEVVVISSCPGLCKSTLGRDLSMFLKVVDRVLKGVFGRSTEAGSRILVSATAQGEEAHGGFWMNDELHRPGELVTSEKGKKLSDGFWKETLDIFRKHNPSIEENLRP